MTPSHVLRRRTPDRAFAVCLFLPEGGEGVEEVKVETMRPLSKASTPDLLASEEWVSEVERWTDSPVFDASKSKIRLPNDRRYSDEAGEAACFTCFVQTADRFYGTPNKSLHAWTDVDIAWYGNILIVAHKRDGELIDFTALWKNRVKELIISLSGVSPFSVVVRHLQDAPIQRRCLHVSRVVQPSSKVLLHRSVFGPNELLGLIMAALDFASLVSASEVCRSFVLISRETVRIAIKKACAPFIASHDLSSFFAELRQCRGLIYGDVALQVVLRRTWKVDHICVCVPNMEGVRFRGWLANLGYVESVVVDESGPWNEMVHCNHEASGNAVWLSISANDKVWTPLIGTGITVAMTAISSSSVYSFYTDWSEQGWIVSDDEGYRDRYESSGFKFSVNGEGLTEPCGQNCPRSVRKLGIKEGVHHMRWRGVEDLDDVCRCETAAASGALHWKLSEEGICANKYCGNYGSNRGKLGTL